MCRNTATKSIGWAGGDAAFQDAAVARGARRGATEETRPGNDDCTGIPICSDSFVCGGNRGFTIIEVIIVVVILGIAAGIVVPMMSSAGSLQVRAAAAMVAADLEYAKSMAISRGQTYSVVFDKTAETYRVVDQDGNVIPHPVKKGFPYVVDFTSDGRLDRVDIVDASFDPTGTVTFDYLGSPFNGGVITLCAGGVTKTIAVEPVTGFVSVATN